MSKNIQTVRGMHDILPAETAAWQRLEQILRGLMHAYGYQEIRLPLLEKTELFSRSIGEVTDIVEKEMYTFEDRNGDSLSLRPEGTAGCVRAGIQHGILHNQIQRLWYMGTMYRHERPQKGRYREFRQLGVEVFGLPGPDVDAEMILLGVRLWRQLGLSDLRLELNSIGSAEERLRYRDGLVKYFTAHRKLLDQDSLERLERNPLRILDSKNPAMQQIIADAPPFSDCLGSESLSHLDGVRAILDQAGVEYTINPKLVRGLDYYNLTVFEWKTTALGAQDTVCAGGRFDGLVEQLGGSATPAIGFAIGLERLLSVMQLQDKQETYAPDACLLITGQVSAAIGMQLTEMIRDALPHRSIVYHCGSASLKSQLKRADRSGAGFALIVGDEEQQAATITVKFLREDRAQNTISRAELANFLENEINRANGRK
ncbi:MAG: histidine--tRNA ligase [Gammaproteobacteria bacterium]|nr:histidine--tRNA ligase [Gammaproteobacteria bacterium]